MQHFSPLKTANWQTAQTNPYSTAKQQMHSLQERVGKLHLDTQQQPMRNDKPGQEVKLKALEEKIRNNKHQEDCHIKGIQDNITQLQDTLQQEKVARELLEERKTKEVKLIEQQL